MFVFLLVGCGAKSGLLSNEQSTAAAPCGSEGVVTLAPRKFISSHRVGYSIAVAGAWVYWVDPGDAVSGDGAVKRVPRCGGAVEVLAHSLSQPYELAVDATHVYWVDPGDSGHGVMGGILRVPLAGGAVETQFDVDDPTHIALDATQVYFAVPASGRVVSAPKQGGPAVVLMTGAAVPGGLAVDATHVYAAAAGTVLGVPKVGGNVVALGPPATIAWNIAIDADSAYWEAGDGSGYGKLMKAPLDASQAPTALASGAITGIAVDASHVYWADNGGGKVGAGKLRRIDKSGGAVETLVSGESSAIGGLVVDDLYVYWLDDDSVMRLEK